MRTRLATTTALIALLAIAALQFASPALAKHHKDGEKHEEKQKDKKTEETADKAEHNVAPEGWTALFNGKDIEAWEIKSGKATYEVKDGIITGTTVKGSPNTFLCTPKAYGDFELKFDVLLHDNGLNSGCQIRSKIVKENDFGGRLGGPQVEIEKGPGQSGLIYGEASGGWQSSADKHKANHKQFNNGQWNTYHIIANGPRIQTFINGEQVEDLELKQDYYERFKEGIIGLQVHSVGGDPKWQVSWRNIYIKELGGE